MECRPNLLWYCSVIRYSNNTIIYVGDIMGKYEENKAEQLRKRILTKMKKYQRSDARVVAIILNPEDGYYSMNIAEVMANIGVPVSIYGVSLFFDGDKTAKSKVLYEFIHKDDRYYSKGRELVVATFCEEL